MTNLFFDTVAIGDFKLYKKSLDVNWVLLSLINLLLTIPLRRNTQRHFHSRNSIDCLIINRPCLANRGGDGI